jgi:hypothetical protein
MALRDNPSDVRPRGGRPPGYLNKRAPAKEAFRHHQADRERYERAGLGPGEAYRGLWRHLHDVLDDMKAAKAANDEPSRRWFSKEYSQTLFRILPYERPRLQTVQLQGDPDRPVMNQEQMAEVIAKMLTQEEIAILDRVAIKLVTHAGGGTTFDTAGNLIGGIGASRRGRPEPGQPRRRKASPAAGKARWSG